MSCSNNNCLPNRLGSLLAEEAARSLLRLALASNTMMNDVDATVKVHPTTRYQYRLKLPILPPWQLGDMVIEEGTGDDSSDIVDKSDLGEEGSDPPSIKVIQWSNDVTNKNEHIDDDDDLSLSLYVGADNNEHHLVEARSYKDVSNIPFAEVAVVVNDPEKQGIFPVLLHHILSSGQHDDSIMWLSHGRAFAIIDEKKFFAQVTLLYFCTCEYELFMKLVKAYGFQQVQYNKYGTKMVVIYHERLLRYRPWLAFTMKPVSHNGEIPSPRSVDHSQELFRYFDQIPALQDVLIPYSAIVTQQALVARQPSFRAWTMNKTNRYHHITAVAHAYLPNPPAFIGWHDVGQSRDEGVTNGNDIPLPCMNHVDVGVNAEKILRKNHNQR